MGLTEAFSLGGICGTTHVCVDTAESWLALFIFIFVLLQFVISCKYLSHTMKSNK